jgi:ATP-binding cassette subfamily B protein
MSETKRHAPLRRLWHYAINHRPRIIVATLFSILNKTFDLAPPFLIGAAVDIVANRENSIIAQVGFADVTSQLIFLGLASFVIWAFESLFEYLYHVLWRNLAQSVQHDLRIDAYSHIQDLELAYFEDRSTGGLLAILNDDINQLERFLDNGANEFLQVLTTVIIVGTAFFAFAPQVAWMSFLPIPIILIGSFWFQRRIAPRYASVREQVSVLSGQLSNNLSGVATIKSFTAEELEIERIRKESDHYRDVNRLAIRLSSAFSPIIRIVVLIGFTATLVYGGFLALSGGLAIFQYSSMVFLIQRLLWPLTRLGETFDLYQRAMASTNRVLDLLYTKVKIVDGPTSLPLGDVAGEVVFADVNFEYDAGFPILSDMNLRMAAGETTAIVGATGSGKTTIIKLILRFYDIQSGSIKLDGHDIRKLKLEDLRKSVGLVSQDVFLFHGDVRENIAYGRPDATDEEIIEAARIAEAHDFILKLPQGYDTVIGERGQKLSGGQRQRISIARAVLKNPPILILDEATSSVDNETEAAIQRSLEKISRDRTTIVIAHRLSTIRNADKIYVLDHGRLVESGRHEELIRDDAIYASLWKVQTGEAVPWHEEQQEVAG